MKPGMDAASHAGPFWHECPVDMHKLMRAFT